MFVGKPRYPKVKPRIINKNQDIGFIFKNIFFTKADVPESPIGSSGNTNPGASLVNAPMTPLTFPSSAIATARFHGKWGQSLPIDIQEEI